MDWSAALGNTVWWISCLPFLLQLRVLSDRSSSVNNNVNCLSSYNNWLCEVSIRLLDYCVGLVVIAFIIKYTYLSVYLKILMNLTFVCMWCFFRNSRGKFQRIVMKFVSGIQHNLGRKFCRAMFFLSAWNNVSHVFPTLDPCFFQLIWR